MDETTPEAVVETGTSILNKISETDNTVLAIAVGVGAAAVTFAYGIYRFCRKGADE